MGVPLARRLRRTALAAVLAMAMLALGGCVQFYEDELDPALIRELERQFGTDGDRAAVAVLSGDRLRTGYLEADDQTVFEVGSVTKLLTGLLLPMAVEAGEVRLDDPVGAYLALGDSPVAEATLEELATHRSGLPLTVGDEATRIEIRDAWTFGGAPFHASVDELLELARAQPAEPTSRAVYSMLGPALLGHALAAAAGTDYATLVRERLLEPLGMDGASLPTGDADLSPEIAAGHARDHRPAAHWADTGWAPSVGLHATLPDLIALARAVLSGGLGESPALDPVADGPNSQQQMGYLWFLARNGERTLVGTRATTGGFAAVFFVDRDAGEAVIVLANEARQLDAFATRVLDGSAGAAGWFAGDP
ncbi:serine hydrolase domain-containing protein [Agromyces sp. SYSU T0242]|uniref:serine hydrolase domain-containing protein n=1 Tax=Agromyces litoreus TaxID=3158561 RepID=UPI00339AAEB0